MGERALACMYYYALVEEGNDVWCWMVAWFHGVWRMPMYLLRWRGGWINSMGFTLGKDHSTLWRVSWYQSGDRIRLSYQVAEPIEGALDMASNWDYFVTLVIGLPFPLIFFYAQLYALVFSLKSFFLLENTKVSSRHLYLARISTSDVQYHQDGHQMDPRTGRNGTFPPSLLTKKLRNSPYQQHPSIQKKLTLSSPQLFVKILETTTAPVLIDAEAIVNSWRMSYPPFSHPLHPPLTKHFEKHQQPLNTKPPLAAQ